MRIEFKIRKWNSSRTKKTWVYPDGNRFLSGSLGDWMLDWENSLEEAFVSYNVFQKEHPLLASLKHFPRGCREVKQLLDWWQKADEEKRKSFACIDAEHFFDVDIAIEYANYCITWLGIKSDDYAGLGAWLAERYRLWDCVDNPEEVKKRFDFAKFARLNEPHDVRVSRRFNEFYVVSEDAVDEL
jgi:hypothetical protein